MTPGEPIPATMSAAVLRGSDAELVIATIAVPRPHAGEALLRVSACGVCHTDLHVMKGEVAFPRPAVLGHEVSGTIVAIGEGTTDHRGFSVGDAVVGGFIMPCTECDACRRGRDDLCAEFFAQNRLRGTLYDGTSRLAMPDGSFLAMYSMGGLAEYCVVPLSALAVVPAEVDLQIACILGCAGLTSYSAVVRAGGVASGDAVVVVGAGGIGSGLIQMAKAAGASIIVAVDIAEDKLLRAIDLGATATVDARAGDPVAAVREATRGGADVAFEALGNPLTFGQASRMLADGGRMVAVGIAAGAATAEIEITPLVRRGYSIVGSFGGRTRVDLPAVVALARTGAFDAATVISRRFSLEEADLAYRLLAAGEITGRAIVTMDARGALRG
jgi:Zn-dependent alcohol dehydrogenase